MDAAASDPSDGGGRLGLAVLVGIALVALVALVWKSLPAALPRATPCAGTLRANWQPQDDRREPRRPPRRRLLEPLDSEGPAVSVPVFRKFASEGIGEVWAGH